MKRNIEFWLNVGRCYSLPMSIMSWSVPFLFGLIDGGNVCFGIFSLLGIICAHIGVNLFDDYCDYRLAEKKYSDKNKFINIFQKGKCAYLINETVKKSELLTLIIVLFTLAIIIGIFLTYKTGIAVLYIMIFAGIIGILYPFLSYIALGEVAVSIMFSPLLYMGVYYVMTQSFSQELTPLAISTGLLTVGLLHAHMFLDYDYDKKNNKITLCSIAGNKNNSLKIQIIILFLAYLNICIQTQLSLPKIYLITFLSIPTAVVLCKILNKENEKIHTNIFFGILENMKQYKERNTENFMIKFMVARNVMVEFTILTCIAKIMWELIYVHF